MQEHALIEKDFSLFYRIAGEGETVVLLHGFAEDGSIWDGIATALRKEYKLIIPDLPGSGRSSGSMENVSMESLADDVNRILVKENIESCFMIGHSMGGYITMAFAEKYAAKLKGLGLFHSTAFADSDEKKAARNKNIEFIKKHGSAKFLEQATPNLFSEYTKKEHPEYVDNLIDKYSNFSAISLVTYTEAMRDRPDRSETLKTFTQPVLLIIGEYDTAIPIEQSLKLCKIADFAYIYIGARSGHMGMLEEPEYCLKAIRDFLSGN
jgi:pimeloyl-ACP methyl ester carboxylesterase